MTDVDVTQFLPSFGGVAFTLIAFVVALSVIVAIHEYGHYIVGRWSGIKADVFSLGFGPVLWSRMDRHGTRWQVAALPFGGYVKFLGDANATSLGGDEAHVPATQRRQTMLGAPLWARFLTVLAGPVFNFLLSFVVFAGVILAEGMASDPARIAALKPLPDSIVQGLRPGDEVLAVGGLPVSTADGYFAVEGEETLTDPVQDWTIRRDGADMVVQGPNPLLPLVGGISPSSAAYDAGLQLGDVIMTVDGLPAGAFPALIEQIITGDGQPIVFGIWRDGTVQETTITPRRQDVPNADGSFTTRWLVGFSAGMFFELETETPGLWQTATAAIGQIRLIVTSSLSGLWHVVTGAISSCALSGPVGIAQASGAMASQGTTSFVWFIATLSTAVGLLNLFPVPMLDGGHLVFYGYEAVVGRPPSNNALRVLMALGLAIIGSLMVLALSNDLFLCP